MHVSGHSPPGKRFLNSLQVFKGVSTLSKERVGKNNSRKMEARATYVNWLWLSMEWDHGRAEA